MVGLRLAGFYNGKSQVLYYLLGKAFDVLSIDSTSREIKATMSLLSLPLAARLYCEVSSVESRHPLSYFYFQKP